MKKFIITQDSMDTINLDHIVRIFTETVSFGNKLDEVLSPSVFYAEDINGNLIELGMCDFFEETEQTHNDLMKWLASDETFFVMPD